MALLVTRLSLTLHSKILAQGSVSQTEGNLDAAERGDHARDASRHALQSYLASRQPWLAAWALPVA
jgi:hypothetical protein